MYFEKNVVKMQKKTYKMTFKRKFIGTFCCVDSLNDRKWLKCSYKEIKNATTYRYHVAINNPQVIQSKQQQQGIGGMSMLKNILVGQSGGPTAVINSSLYGVIEEGLRNKEKIGTVYGMVHGIEGFLAGNFINLSEVADNEPIDRLKITPASFLGSCRYMLPEDLGDKVYDKLFDAFAQMNIGYVFYIGGNDSMDTVSKLSRVALLKKSDIRFIGVPKTIDNDLVMTDHTPGYGSTAKYVASTLREIILDATCYAHPSVTIVELMGRHAGWVTAASVLARTEYSRNPYLIYMPEHAFDMEEFKKSLKAALEQKTAVVVCVSEGIADKDGRFICEYADAASVDGFGHKMLTGCGKYLENYVKAEFGIKCRSIELNLPQRCSSLLASATDIDEAEKAGKAAVVAALDGETGKMITFVRDDTNGYEINYGLADVNDICNKEKKFPAEWITADGTDISDEYIKYVRPLIQGTNIAEYSDGVPVHLKPAYYR